MLHFSKSGENCSYSSSTALLSPFFAPKSASLNAPIEDVSFRGDFDFAVLAQSPNYTPASADFIMDIFREYIEEI